MRLGRLKLVLVKYLARHPLFYDAYMRLKRCLGKRDDTYKYFNKFSRMHKGAVTVIQIGANDGLRNDPIREFIVRDSWNAVLVEPHPGIFKLLTENYRYLKRRNIQFVNAAVSDRSGTFDLYTFGEETLSHLPYTARLYLLRKSSFYPERLIDTAGKDQDLTKGIVRKSVRTITFSDLLGEIDIAKRANLLVVDAEGHEKTILQSIDLSALNLEAIYFENRHLGNDRYDLFDYLSKQGFRLQHYGFDSVATKKGTR
jgi:FkbM family methyltransferase